MSKSRKASVLKTLTFAFAIIAMLFGQVSFVAAQSGQYPLTGSRGDPSSPEFDVIWEANGRLWQDKLVCTEGKDFTVAIQIMPGDYIFNGKEAELRLDESRNGKGMSNPVTVSYGNDLKFTVTTADGKAAWAIVYGKGNRSCGFDIWATPQYGASAPAPVAATEVSTTPAVAINTPVVPSTPLAAVPTQNTDVIYQKNLTVTNDGLMWFAILVLLGLVLFLAFSRPGTAPAPTQAPKATVSRKSATKKSKTTKK